MVTDSCPAAAADAHTGLPVVTEACSAAPAALKEHSVPAVDYVYLLLLMDVTKLRGSYHIYGLR